MFWEYRGIPITLSKVSSVILSLYSFYEHVLHRLVYKSDTSPRQSIDNITDGEIMVKENYFLLLTQLQENYFREEI